jgi:hypothetical protein
VGSSGRTSPSGGTCTCFISRSPRVGNTRRRRFHSIARAQSRGFEPRWPSIEDEVEPSPCDRAHPSSPSPDSAPLSAVCLEGMR